MISLSHWGLFDVGDQIEGPAYADRVRGWLTFRDWERWEPDDQVLFRIHRAQRCRHNVNFKPSDWVEVNRLAEIVIN